MLSCAIITCKAQSKISNLTRGGRSYHRVFGKRSPLPRFLVEDGAKPPIFGSYSYDPVKQIFEPILNSNVTLPSDTHIENTHESTVYGHVSATHHEITTAPVFRLSKKTTFKPTRWWIKPKLAHLKNNATAMRKLKR